MTDKSPLHIYRYGKVKKYCTTLYEFWHWDEQSTLWRSLKEISDVIPILSFLVSLKEYLVTPVQKLQ